MQCLVNGTRPIVQYSNNRGLSLKVLSDPNEVTEVYKLSVLIELYLLPDGEQ